MHGVSQSLEVIVKSVRNTWSCTYVKLDLIDPPCEGRAGYATLQVLHEAGKCVRVRVVIIPAAKIRSKVTLGASETTNLPGVCSTL